MHCNGANSYLFVNGTEINKFKAKDSEVSAYPLCLGNISKDWLVDNMKMIGLKDSVCNYYCNYWYTRHSQAFDKKEWNIIKMFRFVKQMFVSTMMFSGCNLSSVNALECVSINN